MSEQGIQADVLLLPYAPDRACSKCLNEQVDTFFHETAVPGSPCFTDDPARRVWQPHLDRQCLSCRYAWCEAPADSYAGGDPEEVDVSIRKTASGQVLGTEEDGLIKTAAADAPWAPEDEEGLAKENAEAGELES